MHLQQITFTITTACCCLRNLTTCVMIDVGKTALELEKDAGVEVSSWLTAVAVVKQSVSIRYDGFIAHISACITFG